MRAERVPGRARRAQLVLLGQRELRDVGEPARRLGRVEPGRGELLPVERRALEEVRELGAIALVVERELLRPGAGLDLRLQHHSGRYSTASSAFPASAKPIGLSRSSARCASRLAVRARIGTAFTTSGE